MFKHGKKKKATWPSSAYCEKCKRSTSEHYSPFAALQISLNSQNTQRLPMQQRKSQWMFSVTKKIAVNGLILQFQLCPLTVLLFLDFHSTLISKEQRYWHMHHRFSETLSGLEWIEWISVVVRCLTVFGYVNNISW